MNVQIGYFVHVNFTSNIVTYVQLNGIWYIFSL